MVFAREEFERRATELQKAMRAQGIAALLLTSPADVFYASGFLTRFWESPARPWYVIVPAEGSTIAVIPSIGFDLMSQTWIEDVRTWAAPDPVDDGVSLLSDALTDVTPRSGLIAVPMGLETSLRMPIRDYLKLERRLEDRQFVDGTDIIQRVREIKSEVEIAALRRVCAIGDKAFCQVPDIIREEPRLDTVFRQFQIALLEAGADWVSYTAGGAGQGGYGNVISPARPQDLALGDVLMLDTGAVKDGYFCDFDRNFVIGAPSSEVQRAHTALYGATERALSDLRPGMRACDAHQIMSNELTRHGVSPSDGRFGHGLGISLTEWPSLSAKDTTELRENMVLTLEPAVDIAPGRMMVHEENFVLRADGPELLSTRAPEHLPVIDL